MNADTRAYIKHNEGFRQFPYRCSEGYLTIGWGHNLDALGITNDVAAHIFEEDYQRACETAAQFWPAGRTADPARFAIVVDMAFNLGHSRLQAFVKFRAALEAQDFDRAAAELRNSRYYKQVGARAERNAALIATGVPVSAYL